MMAGEGRRREDLKWKRNEHGITDSRHLHGIHRETSPGFFFVCVCLFRAVPAAYGGSQARGRFRAVAVGLSHSSVGSELHLQPTPQPTATPDP